MQVNEDYENVRLDVFLTKVGAYASRSMAAKFCDADKVLVNGKAASKNLKINAGDVVTWVEANKKQEIEGEDIPLDIRFEDKYIIVLSKQPGLVCHPAPCHNDGTLVNALIYHCGKDNLCNIQDDQQRLGIVHRLDGGTSGLMVCAKTNEAGMKLSEDMRKHSTLRCYKALVYGHIKHKTGKIDIPLLRTINKRPKMIASNEPQAKNATTTFKVLELLNYSGVNFSLVECKIITGRTHQIRAHMEYIKHPVVGDPLYFGGSPKNFDADTELGIKRQFLHSCKIGFNHPTTNEYMEFEDNLCDDLLKVLNNVNLKN